MYLARSQILNYTVYGLISLNQIRNYTIFSIFDCSHCLLGDTLKPKLTHNDQFGECTGFSSRSFYFFSYCVALYCSNILCAHIIAMEDVTHTHTVRMIIKNNRLPQKFCRTSLCSLERLKCSYATF